MEHPVAGGAATPFDPKINSSIEELSGLVHFPSALDPAAGRPAAYDSTLWSNGADFDPEKFRKKLEEIVNLFGAR